MPGRHAGSSRAAVVCLSPHRLRGATCGGTAGLIPAGRRSTLSSLDLAGPPWWPRQVASSRSAAAARAYPRMHRAFQGSRASMPRPSSCSCDACCPSRDRLGIGIKALASASAAEPTHAPDSCPVLRMPWARGAAGRVGVHPPIGSRLARLKIGQASSDERRPTQPISPERWGVPFVAFVPTRSRANSGRCA
jgi:hypothetical protein